MKERRVSPPNSGPSVRPRQLWQWLLAVLTLLAVVCSSFLASSTPSAGPLPAAQPTNPAEDVSNLSKLASVQLPRNKAEAAAFEKLYHSPFNFEQVQALNAAYSKDSINRFDNIAQDSGPAPATPGVVDGTRAPGSLLKSNAGLTPTPTSTGGTFRANGSPGCVGQNPGTLAADGCENDDNPSAATSILANDVAQGHNFISSTGQAVDFDYMIFQVTQTYLEYNITLTIQPTVTDTLPTLVLLDSTASTVISGGVNTSPGILTISNFVPTVAGNYYIRVTPPSVSDLVTYTKTFYYTIKLTTGNTVPTPTPTTAATVTGTSGPTNTPVPCRDDYENDDSPSNAKQLKPSFGDQPPFAGTPAAPGVASDSAAVQSHYICPSGDIDWVYMDLVKGKSYSIYTSGLTNGLDTFMVLYTKDAAGNYIPIYSSDDSPGMGLASRIDWIVPATNDTPLGQFVRYYAAVKDVAGHGDLNMKYNLILETAGNPLGNCFDQYEPDNNPLEAKDILLNESQVHNFCPSGDHDWVRFFVKAGRTYSVSTSFPAGAVGLDTSVYIWRVNSDPNDPGKIVEQRLLAQNDDRSDTDVSSSVNFTVPNDGYYYAEVRNAGDIGRNGLYYTLRFSNAGAPPVDTGGTATAASVARFTQTAAAQTATAAAQTAGAATATRTATTTTGAGASIESQLLRFNFTDSAFQRLWFFSDLVVLAGKSQRSWEWGPTPAQSKIEPYIEANGGSRQVQYFDKARMEINNPKGDHNSKWFVTNGLLVKELVSGWVATGNTQAELRGAAQIPIAGDLLDTNPGPTYASFQNLITVNGTNRAENLSGQVTKLALNRDGAVSTLATPPEQLKLGNYIKETGHNIPDIFWDYLNATGTVYDGGNYRQDQLRDWVFTVGLPLSEAYWVKTNLNGVERDVLVQLFERRVLTYTPSNPADWRVEMANVGQHYFLWRYNARLESNIKS